MPTRALFWQDAYLRECDAFVIAQTSYEGRPAAVLDATCFYPTSGGQPCDLGTLNGRPVRDVVEQNHEILHVTDEPLPLGPVHGVIDWQRRWDHMQQHTGQHILSQAFERLLDAATVSFHLGEEAATIDLDLTDLDAPSAARVEDLANQVVMENRPIATREYTALDIARLDLRKAPPMDGPVRVVEVTGFDRCACGGTHLRATAEVGIIHISRWERQRGQTRVEFLCGKRAVAHYRQREAVCRGLALGLSVAVDDLPVALQRLTAAEAEARRQAEGLRRQLLDYEWPRLAEQAEAVGNWRVLCRLLAEYDAGNMRYLAQRLAQRPGVVALLAVTHPAPQICFARAADVPIDMAALLRRVAAPFGGRGGGQPHMAQGGGVAEDDLPALLAAARSALEQG